MGLGQEILGVYYSGGEISEATLQMINVMTDYNNYEYVYTPSHSAQAYDLYVEPYEFIFNYLDTFIKNPILTIRALLCREDTIWDIYAGDGCTVGLVNFHGTVDSDFDVQAWNEYYPKRVYVSLYDTMAAATEYTAESQWISSLIWRCGLFTLSGLMAIIYMIIKKGVDKHILIAAPIIGHILSLLLSTGWSDFRYFWPLNLLNMCVLVLVPVITLKETRRHDQNDGGLQ